MDNRRRRLVSFVGRLGLWVESMFGRGLRVSRRMGALAAGFIVVLPCAAVAQYDAIGDCQRHATEFYQRDSDFRSFAIDARSVEEVAYDGNVGSQYIAAIFRGRATYTGRR